MALWLVRGGAHGEHELRFHEENRVYLTWEGLKDHNLVEAKNTEGVFKLLQEGYPGDAEARLRNWSRQISAFVFSMKPTDWVVVPKRGKSAIGFGEIQGPYTYDAHANPLYRHFRTVKWLNWEVPRSVFDQDLLYTFGAAMTVCQLRRNEAESRVRAIAKNGWKAVGEGPGPGPVDLERLGRDQIAELIRRKFKGHDMARLVEAILKAQGYTTYTSPPGPDKGVDILAAPGALGFGKPRICVQVKSQDSPVDSPTVNQLIGAMQNVQAEQGLLVAWGGFKSSVEKEVAAQFFRVRLWDQEALIGQLLEQYEKLDEDLRAELPLKRIWTVAIEEPEE